jgi:hypothetical protein
MDAAEQSVRTDVSASDLARIFRHPVDPDHSAVLSTGNVLENGTSSDGQFILTPRNGSWALVHEFVDRTISGERTAQR